MMKTETLHLTRKWDKTFAESDKVDHCKVTFVNRYGITLAADMYVPKVKERRFPAIAVCGPFGAVKEQCSGLSPLFQRSRERLFPGSYYFYFLSFVIYLMLPVLHANMNVTCKTAYYILPEVYTC